MMQQVSGMQYRRIDPAVECLATTIRHEETNADRPVRAMPAVLSTSSTIEIACPNEITRAMTEEPHLAVEVSLGGWCGPATSPNDSESENRSRTDGTDGLIDAIYGVATPPGPSASLRPSNAPQKRAAHRADIPVPAAAPNPASAAFTPSLADHIVDMHAALAGSPAPPPQASTYELLPVDLRSARSEPARPDAGPAGAEAGGGSERPAGAERGRSRASAVPSAVAQASCYGGSYAAAETPRLRGYPAHPPADTEHRPAPAPAELSAHDCGEEDGGEDSDAWSATGGTCFVCLDAAADAVLVECGHGGMCAGDGT